MASNGSTARLTAGIACVSTCSSLAWYAMSTTLPLAIQEVGRASEYGWAVSMFAAGMTFGICAGGRLGMHVRPAIAELVAMSLFAAGLVIAAVAPSAPVLVGGRFLQGIGAGMDVVVMYVIIARCYPPERRPAMVALVNVTLVIPGMIGPAGAGWVAEHAGWRVVFVALALALVPSALLTAIPVWRLGVERDARPPSTLLAAAGVVVGLMLLQLAGPSGPAQSVLWLTCGLAVVGIGAWRILPRGTMRLRPGLPSATGMRGLLAAAYFGGQVWIPTMLISVRGLSPAHAGLALVGAPLGWGLGAFWQTRATAGQDGFAGRRRHVAIGSLCSCVGMVALLCAVITPVPLVMVIAIWTIAATGMGLATSSVTVLLLDVSGDRPAAAVTMGMQLADNLSSATAIALGTVIFQVAAVSASRSSAFVAIFTLAAVLCLLAAVCSRRLPRMSAPPLAQRSLGGVR